EPSEKRRIALGAQQESSESPGITRWEEPRVAASKQPYGSVDPSRYDRHAKRGGFADHIGAAFQTRRKNEHVAGGEQRQRPAMRALAQPAVARIAAFFGPCPRRHRITERTAGVHHADTRRNRQITHRARGEKGIFHRAQMCE